jgi:hypothetical protein
MSPKRSQTAGWFEDERDRPRHPRFRRVMRDCRPANVGSLSTARKRRRSFGMDRLAWLLHARGSSLGTTGEMAARVIEGAAREPGRRARRSSDPAAPGIMTVFRVGASAGSVRACNLCEKPASGWNVDECRSPRMRNCCVDGLAYCFSGPAYSEDFARHKAIGERSGNQSAVPRLGFVACPTRSPPRRRLPPYPCAAPCQKKYAPLLSAETYRARDGGASDET